MTSTMEDHYDAPLLLNQPRTVSVCLPSIVESIIVETPSQTSSHDLHSTIHSPQHGRRIRRRFLICRRLKRLISSKNAAPTTRGFTSTSSSSNACDEVSVAPSTPATPREDDSEKNRSCCSCSLKFPLFRGFFNSLSRSLDRLTGRRMPNENLFVLSMIQLLCGLAAVVLSGVAVTKVVFLYQMATGLWSGLLMLATGFHGILTARRCTPRTLVSLLIFCVLVALSACLLACVSVAGLIEDGVLRPESTITLISAANSPYLLASASPSIELPPLGGFSHRRLVSTNQPPRIHQVMLHVLLLVIGILEASVSVACAVLCCRQICPSDNSPPLSAIAYLQNRGATLVPGGSEFLLAVAADPSRDPPVLLDYPLPPADLHPSAHHFLPRAGRRVVILTQAETGIHALAAAQAVASLVVPGSHHPQTPSTSMSSTQRAQKRKESARLRAQLSDVLPRLASNAPIDAEFRSSHPSNLLYVLSSPSPTDAPMVFPPFPPAYSAEDELETTISAGCFVPPHRMHPQAFNLGPLRPQDVRSLPSNRSRHRSHRRDRLNGSSGGGSRRNRFALSSPRHQRRRGRSSAGSMTDSAVGLLGDRILQPVLVVELDGGRSNTTEEGVGIWENRAPPPRYFAMPSAAVRPLPPMPEEDATVAENALV